jgi:hypothetical protein
MRTRIRVISGCAAVGATLLLTGTAANAMTLGEHASHVASVQHVTGLGKNDGGGCGSNCCGGNGNGGSGNGCGNTWNGNNWNNCSGGCSRNCMPTPTKTPCPTPTPPCKTSTPPPPVVHYTAPPPTPTPSVSTSTVVVTVTSTATVPPPPQVVSATPVPSGPAQTGGGISPGGDTALAAGGGVAALTSSGFGLFAIRRWQQARKRRVR